MQLEAKYEEVKKHFDEVFQTSEVYVVLANYLLTVLSTLSTTEENKDTSNFKYAYKDLLDYNYVLEYLKYNPTDETLVLAHTIHSLLFLHTLEAAK